MSDHMNHILLVGCGYMGQEYASVLKALGVDFVAVGRGEANARVFEEKTGVKPFVGGVEKFLDENAVIPKRAIVAVNAEYLYDTVCALLARGVKEMLLEKPGAHTYEKIEELNQIANAQGCRIYIAYNRRFYSSVLKAQEMIEEDGGVSSFYFEFTEWVHKFVEIGKLPEDIRGLFLGNSTHVVDMAFYLGGLPKSMSSYITSGEGIYKNISSFSGAGIAQNGASFSYRADWDSAGRWVVEILTKKRKLIFRPLEELKCQMRGSVAENKVEIDNTLDVKFKPGLFLQTKAFFEDPSKLLSLEEHAKRSRIYYRIERGGCLDERTMEKIR